MIRVIQFFCLFLVSIDVLAFQVEPMMQFFDVSGRGAQQIYKVENENDVDLAVEVVSYRIERDDKGAEVLVEDEGDFLILPPQARLAPGSYQSFRVRYIGSEPITSTTPYRIIFKQLSLEEESKESKIELLFDFSTLAFVSPPNSRAIPQVAVKDGKSIFIENLGQRVLDLNNWSLELVDSNGDEKLLIWEDLQEVTSSRFVMPQTSGEINLESLPFTANELKSASLTESR